MFTAHTGYVVVVGCVVVRSYGRKRFRVTSGLMVASVLVTCGLVVASDCDLELRFSCGDKPIHDTVSRNCCDLRSASLRRQHIAAVCDCDHKRAKFVQLFVSIIAITVRRLSSVLRPMMYDY